jgi:hypothetical protein
MNARKDYEGDGRWRSGSLSSGGRSASQFISIKGGVWFALLKFNRYCSIFHLICQLVFNYRLIRLNRFVS